MSTATTEQDTNKDCYRELCAVEPSIPIFSRDWWLDAVCGDAWNVCLIRRGGQIVATMPYYIRKKYGLTYLGQPALTQTMGPWIRASNAKYAKRLGQEKDLMNQLIDQLPPYASLRHNWHHGQTNWLPFYWHGFHQTTRYTYRLEDLSDLDAIWSGFRENIRGDIRKAKNRYDLRVRSDLGINEFLELNLQTFERQGMRMPYETRFIGKLDAVCEKKNARRILIAEDSEGRRHAGVYIIWDENSAYYLMGGGNPALRGSGATSLCMWEAIQFAASVTKSFDFEGSMIEPVERFCRAFGAVQTPYFCVFRTPSRLLEIAMSLRAMAKRQK